jgi:putative salt-induced outer membrane protein YdiY
MNIGAGPIYLRLSIIILSLVISAPAFGQALSEDYRRLLVAAAETQDDAGFSDTVALLARVAPGGAPSVLNALADIAPNRLALAENRFMAADIGVENQLVQAETEVPAAPVSDIAVAGSGLLNAPLAGWSGRASAGLRIDTGNSDQQDYTLGLEVGRDLAEWGFEAGVDYAYSEAGGAVSRDQLSLTARGERDIGSRFSLFLGGEYDQDQLSSYEFTSFISAGLAYRPELADNKSWVLRAGPGIRYVSPVTGSAESQFALELGSDFEWQVSETSRFTSETSLLMAQSSRAEQKFAFITALSEAWAIEASWRYRHEFEPLPGFEEGDSRFDISIVREF